MGNTSPNSAYQARQISHNNNNIMETFLQQAKDVIEKIKYLNIASISSEGFPWNTPVYTSYDKNLNFYWLSWKKNQHSQNIEHNPQVFITIYDSSVPEGTGFGVYFQGKASRVIDPTEILILLKSHYSMANSKMRAVEKFIKKFPRRVYKFTPEKAWVNGDAEIEGEPIDTRVELNLEK